MHQLLSSKRVAYRNQIRRKEINELFCQKRKLLTHSLPMDVEQQTFKNIFQLLKEEKNRSNTLAQLSSLTFQRCLSQQAQNQNQAESMYEQLIIYLINIILKNVKRQREETVQRITCLNIIGNLLTQPLCPNSKVSNQICQMLINFYEGVQQWGKQDEEICEVGWVVSNLINRQNFALEIDDSQINFLLQWIEQLLHLKNRQLIQNIFFGLKRFIPSLQERYNLSSCQIPQLHKSHILIILDLIIFDQQINQAEVFTSSNKIAEFLEEIIPVVMVSCSFDWTERIILTVFDNLGTFKKKLFKSLCKIINRMMNFRDVRFHSQQEVLKAESVRRKAQNLIMEKYFTKFIIFLQTRETLMKEQLLDVLTKLLQCQKVDSCYYLSRLLQSGLQELMIKIFTVDNPDLSFALMQLVRVGSELDLSHGFVRFISHKMICNIIEHYKSQ